MDRELRGKDRGAAKIPEEEPRRFCRKCLLRDMDEGAYFEGLRNYIRHLDEDLKVSRDVYEERLAFCRECDNLISGMCRICGCYVELRAAMKKNVCPMVKPRWNAVPEGQDGEV